MARGIKIKNFKRGDARVIEVPVFEADGVTPFDLEGSEVFFTMNASDSPTNDGTDATASIRLSTTTFDPLTPGIATFTLTNALTQPLALGTYYVDTQVIDSGGNPTSSPTGTIEVVPDITTRIT